MARPPATLSSALLLVVGTSSALRLPPALLDISRQGAAGLACAALLATSQPVMPAFAAGCQLDCFKECNKVPAPAARTCTHTAQLRRRTSRRTGNTATTGANWLL